MRTHAPVHGGIIHLISSSTAVDIGGLTVFRICRCKNFDTMGSNIDRTHRSYNVAKRILHTKLRWTIQYWTFYANRFAPAGK